MQERQTAHNKSILTLAAKSWKILVVDLVHINSLKTSSLFPSLATSTGSNVSLPKSTYPFGRNKREIEGTEEGKDGG